MASASAQGQQAGYCVRLVWVKDAAIVGRAPAARIIWPGIHGYPWVYGWTMAALTRPRARLPGHCTEADPAMTTNALAARLRDLLRLLAVTDHAPGRLCLGLGVPLDASSLAQLSTGKVFFSALKKIPGIQKVEVYPLRQSCVIEYDVEAILPASLENLVNDKMQGGALDLHAAIMAEVSSRR